MSLADKKITYLSVLETFKILNIAVNSANIRTLKTPYASIRPSLHCIISGRIGGMKSSLLYSVGDVFKEIPVLNIPSKAVLMGSVDKQTGIPIKPLVWDIRNKALLVDEISIDEKNSSQRNGLNILLSLLEKPIYKKNIAYRINDYYEKDKDLYCNMKNGTIDIKTRFVFIGNTMQLLYRKQKMIELEALKSRCLIIPYSPSIEDIKLLMRNKLQFKYKKLSTKQDVKVNQKTYDDIESYLNDKNIEPELYARTFGDILRVFAICKWDTEIFDIVIKLRQNYYL